MTAHLLVRVGWVGLGCLVIAATGCSAPAEPAAADGDVISVEPGADAPLDGKADSAAGLVEVKVLLDPDAIDEAISRFGLVTSKAAVRDVWFYDTESLDLFDQGLALRARKKKNDADDSTVKLRPVLPEDVAPEWFDESGFKCEQDWTGDRHVDSCSLTVTQDSGEIDDVGDGVRAVKALFSNEQETFADTSTAGPVDYDELLPLGPIDARVWTVKTSSLGKLTFEHWDVAGELELCEVSLRVSEDEATAIQQKLDAYLAKKGLPTTEAETKTKSSLDVLVELIGN
jgi:hypothetical protein